MMNKFLFVLIVLLAIFGLVDTFLLPTNDDRPASFDALSLAQFLAFVMMLKNSALRKSKFFRYMQLCFTALIIGVLFKILHLTGADQILVISLFSVGVVYTIYFFSKSEKNTLDYLKACMMFFLFVMKPLLEDFVIHSDTDVLIVMIIGHVLVWGTFGLFIYQGIRRRSLF
ncbi:GldL-related protein [Pseudochryseolinea flava]|uniref:Gliding motility protein GldL-like N-terminal domain-containing protein n=1 Tax=Pseudochryseolinea flava TaxID=2059302 RepID=A0A364Y9L9_9BACT|nr:hypothetical protein [Pseudochryseolinea flava]RAW02912.1 hypothetical protein DQQ10_02045 [Pseudochryseolinea flava]